MEKRICPNPVGFRANFGRISEKDYGILGKLSDWGRLARIGPNRDEQLEPIGPNPGQLARIGPNGLKDCNRGCLSLHQTDPGKYLAGFRSDFDRILPGCDCATPGIGP